MQRHRRDLAQRKLIAIVHEPVELRTVAGNMRRLPQNIDEDALHAYDPLANHNLPAECLFQIGRSREVVGMGVGFEQPVNRQPLPLHIGDHRICIVAGGAARCRIKVEDRINDRRAARCRIVDDMCGGVGFRIKERADNRPRIGRKGLGDKILGQKDWRIVHATAPFITNSN